VYTLAYALSWLFFFSSRRRHTRSKRDWSSDVCSSDLRCPWPNGPTDSAAPCSSGIRAAVVAIGILGAAMGTLWIAAAIPGWVRRSEERRVGKEGRSGRGPEQSKRKTEQSERDYGAWET